MKKMNAVNRLFFLVYIFFKWFELGIEGKDPMDQDEEDWGGKIEFGFYEKTFPTDLEDYFLLFENKCSQIHTCAGRVMGIQSHVRERVIKPPSYDPRDIVALVEMRNMGMLT